MEEINNAGGQRPRFSDAHLKDRDLFGCRLPDTVDLDEPLEQDDFLLVYGLSPWLVGQRNAKL